MSASGVVQFAFYGRTTSPDWRASRAWQYARGKALIEPHGGVIAAEFFDIDKSRSIPMSTFGSLSKGERNRIKIRVRAAMAAQAQTEGRYLGGRPPYGYTLVDAGPHPNPARAADGKRLSVLARDEPAAVVVERIFAEFLAGFGIFAIAERLTRDGIGCASARDRARNRHRCGLACSKSAVRAILANPRYTGRQVWNRQRKDEVLLDVHDVALGHTTVMRWNDQDKWIFSEQIVHPPIITDETFGQAQQLLAAKNARQVTRRPRTSPRPYVLRGLLFCGICTRRMQGSWNNGQAYYALSSLGSTQRATSSVSLRAVCSPQGRASRPLASGLHGIDPTPWSASRPNISRSSSRCMRLYWFCIETNLVQPWRSAVYCNLENCQAHMDEAPR